MSNSIELQTLNERLKTQGGNILIVQTAFLGDVVLCTALIRAVRQSFPKSCISLLAIPQFSDIIKNQVDRVILFDKRNKKNRKKEIHRLIRELKSQEYDLAFIPHRSFTSGYVAAKAGIPVRIGFKKGNGSYFHTHTVKYPRDLYEGNRNLELLGILAKSTDTGIPVLTPDPEDDVFIDKLLQEIQIENGDFIVFAPGSVWKTKQWIPEYYRELSNILVKKHDIKTIIIGGKEDEELGKKISSDDSLNLSGKLSLLQSTTVVKRAKLLISGDTAPAHIATSIGTKQIIIFGSTVPAFGFAPDIPSVRIVEKKLWCRPCTSHGRKKCPIWMKMKCLTDITPDIIYNKMKDWL